MEKQWKIDLKWAQENGAKFQEAIALARLHCEWCKILTLSQGLNPDQVSFLEGALSDWSPPKRWAYASLEPQCAPLTRHLVVTALCPWSLAVRAFDKVTRLMLRHALRQ